MKPTLAILSALVLCGCANQLLSEDRIRDKTAETLGQSPASVTIADRRYDGATNTSYTARTPRGAYSCVINGGSVMAFGMTNPPTCTPTGSAPTARTTPLPPFARH